MLTLLEKVENRFSNKYKTVQVNGQKCFVGNNGTVFYFIGLRQLKGIVVEYANDLQTAKNDMFDDGDLIPVDQPFESLIEELTDEIELETNV